MVDQNISLATTILTLASATRSLQQHVEGRLTEEICIRSPEQNHKSNLCNLGLYNLVHPWRRCRMCATVQEGTGGRERVCSVDTWRYFLGMASFSQVSRTGPQGIFWNKIDSGLEK